MTTTIPVRTISSFDNAEINRIIGKAHDAAINAGKPVLVKENGLSCKFGMDISRYTKHEENQLYKENEAMYDICKYIVGPGLEKANGIYIVNATEAFEAELSPTNANSETIMQDYFSTHFIESLVNKAYKKRKGAKSIIDSIVVENKGLSCHYVSDIKESDVVMTAAIHLWNDAQDGFRRMVIGKGLKTKKAIYVIYSDRYIDSIGSFWKFYN